MERRRINDRRGLDSEQARFADICEEAGVVYQGCQEGFLDIEAVILFSRSRLDTTRCLPVSKCSVDAIREKLARTPICKLGQLGQL